MGGQRKKEGRGCRGDGQILLKGASDVSVRGENSDLGSRLNQQRGKRSRTGPPLLKNKLAGASETIGRASARRRTRLGIEQKTPLEMTGGHKADERESFSNKSKLYC